MTKSNLKSALEEILGVPSGALRDEDSRDSIEAWTSIADLQLFTIISIEFGIEADSELLEAETVGDILRVLENRGVFRQ